ncbi:MAG: oligosaccharide flippase family protein [Erysipelotrichaceae bacterium]
MNKKKQTIIAGGLISSAGIFISKLIGILYVIPLQNILGAENMVYYGMAFNIYSYILNVATAGIPFAVATMVARYIAHGDYKTSLLIKKLSLYLMAAFGLLSMFILMLTSGIFANIMASDLGKQGIENMRNVLIVISVALFFVPVLSALRGFYQGLKEMEIYAKSQVLEQLSRVIFLLVAGAIIVYGLNWDRIWATYFAVLSAAVAAALAFIHLSLYDRKQMPRLKMQALNQEIGDNDDRKLLTTELIMIALPYLMVAILGYSDMIINTLFVNKALAAHGNSSKEVLQIVSVVFTPVQKIMSIPMVLAPGFSVAIIPYITSALAKNDFKGVRKNITECVDSVLFIAIPISFCLFIFAKPIMSFIAGGTNLNLNAEILRWFSMEAFISTIAPIFNALMMACRMQKINIRNLFIFGLIKLITTYPFIAYFGYPGMVLSSLLSLGICILLDVYTLSKVYHIRWATTMHRIICMVLSLIGIVIVSLGCNMIGINGYGHGMFINTLQLAISGGLGVLAYLAISYFFQLPQMIFHIDLTKLLKRGKKDAS